MERSGGDAPCSGGHGGAQQRDHHSPVPNYPKLPSLLVRSLPANVGRHENERFAANARRGWAWLTTRGCTAGPQCSKRSPSRRLRDARRRPAARSTPDVGRPSRNWAAGQLAACPLAHCRARATGSWVLGPASIYSGTIFEIFLDDLCVRWKKKFKIFSELEEAGPRTQDPRPHKPP